MWKSLTYCANSNKIEQDYSARWTQWQANLAGPIQ